MQFFAEIAGTPSNVHQPMPPTSPINPPTPTIQINQQQPIMVDKAGLNLPQVSNNFSTQRHSHGECHDKEKFDVEFSKGVAEESTPTSFAGRTSGNSQDHKITTSNTNVSDLIKGDNTKKASATEFHRPSTTSFASLLRRPRQIERTPDVLVHRFTSLQPDFSGEIPTLRVPKEHLLPKINQFEHALIGRLLLRKGEKPRLLTDLKRDLQVAWNIDKDWQIIPMGKSFYTIKFNTAEDKAFVQKSTSWELPFGTMRLREWVVIMNCRWSTWNFKIAVVHGVNTYAGRRRLWLDLLDHIDGNVVFIGDFNAVKGAHERSSDCMPNSTACAEFCDFIEATGFIETLTVGLKYTWSGRRFMPTHVESRLDRSIYADSFANLWSSVFVQALPRSSRVESVFGNVDSCIMNTQQELLEIQNQIARDGYTEDLFDKEVEAQAKINVVLSRQSSLLQQKSRVSWLQDGDRNTKLFNAMLRFRRKPHIVSHMEINGDMNYDQKVIGDHIVDFFSSLFSTSSQANTDIAAVETVIEEMVEDRYNNLLIRLPDEEEISAAVFQMKPNSSPGPDGFSGVWIKMGAIDAQLILAPMEALVLRRWMELSLCCPGLVRDGVSVESFRVWVEF
ncbi:uncharacterized protein LOC131009578 [Salvia miltiorrhiza]|uniref:uncharacterized protein LOC131009578 n=1 Tax=Salvia miltiorrhiza TaxID=226208 RepID=UPI0025ACC7C8|nr:uncharacterized protein LOC131009578 [Salvia miltiorrhiza]